MLGEALAKILRSQLGQVILASDWSQSNSCSDWSVSGDRGPRGQGRLREAHRAQERQAQGERPQGRRYSPQVRLDPHVKMSSHNDSIIAELRALPSFD